MARLARRTAPIREVRFGSRAEIKLRHYLATLSDFEPETVEKFEKQFAEDEYTPSNQK